MGKHKKWTLEQKVKIVKEFKKGATISYLNNKYGISGCGTVSRWNQEYDEGNEPAQVGHYVCDGCGKPFIVEPVIMYKVKKEEEAKDFSELSASLLD